MAFTVDSTSSHTLANAAVISFSHTVNAGTNRLLIVGASLNQGGDGTATATYGGVAMTKVGFLAYSYLFALVNPPVGTATVTVNTSFAFPISAGGMSGSGAHQTATFGSMASVAATGAASSLSVPSGVGDTVVDHLTLYDGAGAPLPTFGTGQTQRWSSPGAFASAASTKPGEASTTGMSWTTPANSQYWYIGVAVKTAPPSNTPISGTSTGTSLTSATAAQGRPVTGTATGVSLTTATAIPGLLIYGEATGSSITSGWLARYPLRPTVIAFRGGPKRLARSMWRATVDNVRVEDITAKVTGASVSMDIDRTIPSTLSVDLIDPAVVRPYSDYLAPTVTITEIVSGTAVTSQVGLYRAGLPSVTRHPNAVVGTVGGEDIVSLLVNSGTGAAPYNLAPGANYMAAAVSQCALAGVTRTRFPVDARTVPTGKYHSWPPGTARCRIVFDLMTLLGYLHPWSDHEGYLVTRVVQDPGAQAPARSYVDGDGSDLTGEVTSDPATTTLANHLVVTYDDITAGTVLTAERTNTDPTSPASIPNIGERFRHEAMTQAADQAAVNAYADQLVELWGNVLMHLSLTTPLDPVRGYWESADVAIHADRDDGGLVGRFRVKGFDHDLSAGTTAVGLRRTEPFGKAVV